MGLKIMPRLPTDGIPHPWDLTMRLLDEPLPISPLFQPAIQQHMDLAGGDWRITLYWVVKKKWKPKLKIPVKRKYAKLLEPRGKLFFRTLELCISGHNSSHPDSQHYRNASDWYLQLMQEARNIDNQEIQANEAIGKKPFVQNLYQIIKTLKSLENPATPSTSLHFYRLMEVAMSLEKQNQFNNLYWKPFLSALSGWIQAVDSPSCHECYVDGDKIVCQVGQGRGKRTILVLPSKNVF